MTESIPARFREAVRAGPDRLAVRGRQVSWTYRELDAVSNRVAHSLLARSPDPARPVLLSLETDAPLLAAMLGVLKAGLFYVPVDPAFGPERAAALTDLAGPSLVVTRRKLDELLATGDDSDPDLAIPPESWAYLLFTSGTTGEPKGIIQTHRNVLASVAKLASGLRVTPEDRFTLLISASYGASVSDIYGALLNGAAVLPFDPRAVSPGAWRDWAAAEGITIWHSVPGLFRSLARAVDHPGQLPALRLFKLGGEPVFATDLDLFKSRFREGAVFHVGLGMTEMNVICQWFADHGTVCPGPVTPVGRPAGNTKILLLGLDLGIDGEPVEEEGELGLVAATLPPVYWRRPDLTAQAFRPAPDHPEERLFLTGDLVRRLPDGNLLHLGRRDRQLKVRGLRVDAAVVEGALRGLPGVRDAAVDLRDRSLIAWIVADGEPDLPALRQRLTAALPSEAVPAQLVAFSEDLPTLGPGKIDRARLPDPPAGRRDLDTPFIAPESTEEASVAAVFAEVLGLGTIGALDDFFALGGTSLLTLDALLGLERLLGRPVDAALFLEEPTPRGIARRLSAARGLLATLDPGEGLPVFYIPGHGGGEGPDLLQLARIARKAGLAGESLALRLPLSVPATPEALLEAWSEAILARQPEGPWRLVAICAGGPIGFALATRLSRRGEVRLILHDAQLPTRTSRLRRLLRRLREPWGDDLLVRLRHHLGELRRRSLRAALAYFKARTRSAVTGLERMATPTIQRMMEHQNAYLRLAQTCRLEPWPGETLLIVTPARRAQNLPSLWRALSPRLAVCETGEDAELESAVAIRGFFATLA